MREELIDALGEGRFLAPVLRGLKLAQLEASVRATRGRLRADRMMIERADPELLGPLAAALGVPCSPRLVSLRDLAVTRGLPLILGWDLSAGALKLYVNGSDVSETTRRALGAELGLEGAPHVVGVNVRRDTLEEEAKAYWQSADPRALAEEHGPAARALASAVSAAGLAAGAVASFDVRGGTIAPRAYFVALRPAEPATLDAVLGSLRGFSWARVADCVPFEPATPRSIGIDHGDPSRWTAYVKPRAVASPLWHLEPVMVARAGGVEVGLYVAPDAETERAYARVAGVALAYRVRGGSPDPSALEVILEWARGELEAGRPLDEMPPTPWRRV